MTIVSVSIWQGGGGILVVACMTSMSSTFFKTSLWTKC